MVEYALILVLVAVVVIVILATLGPVIRLTFAKVIAGINCGQYMDEFAADQAGSTISADAFMLADEVECFAATGGPNIDDINVEQVYGPYY